MAKKPLPLSANELTERLHIKWQPPEWIVLEEVRNSTGYARQERYADVLALSTYPSRGVQLIGCELKSSRSDVTSELANPDKSIGIQQYCDRWYLVVGRDDLVTKDEVPENWGLMVPFRGGLKIAKEAPKLWEEDEPNWPRLFIASVLRNAVKSNLGDAERRKIEKASFAKGLESGKADSEYIREEFKKLKTLVNAFERAAGLRLSPWMSSKHAEEEAAAFRLAKNLGIDRQAKRAINCAQNLEQIAEHLRETVDMGVWSVPKKGGPIYKHDCENCVWLGTIAHRNSVRTEPCDLYACKKDDSVLVMARYGPKAGSVSQKLSTEDAVQSPIPELIVAVDLAVMRGLA